MAQTDPVVIGYQSNKFVKDSTTKVLTLYRPSDGSGYDALRSNEGSDYQVPLGSKFTILKCTITLSSDNANYQGVTWWQHSSAGVAGGTQIFGHFTPQVPTDTYTLPYELPVYMEITAGNYINTQHDSAQIVETITGVESDA